VKGGREQSMGRRPFETRWALDVLGRIGLPPRRPPEPMLYVQCPCGRAVHAAEGSDTTSRVQAHGALLRLGSRQRRLYVQCPSQPMDAVSEPCFPQGGRLRWAPDVLFPGHSTYARWASGVRATGIGRTALEFQRASLDINRCLLDVRSRSPKAVDSHRGRWTDKPPTPHSSFARA
jgi:hypothetical protein